MNSSKRKREYPLVILEALSTLQDEFSRTGHQMVANSRGYFTVKDNFSDSNFYFAILDVEYRPDINGDVFFTCEYYPSSPTELQSRSFHGSHEDVSKTFEFWKKYVYDYQKIPFFADKIASDPIIDQYKNEYQKGFELADEDADNSSYPLEVQKYIDRAVESAVVRLEVHKENLADDSEKLREVTEIIEELTELQATQTRLTKRQVIEKLSSVYAKARKAGLKFLKDIGWEATKEVVKNGVKYLMENSDDIGKFLENS